MKNIVAVLILICLFTVSRAFANEASRPDKVGALARLEPHQGVYELAGPSFVVPAMISKILVKEGQMLNKGDVVAVLDMADVRRLEAGIARAEVEQQKLILRQKAVNLIVGRYFSEISPSRRNLLTMQATGINWHR